MKSLREKLDRKTLLALLAVAVVGIILAVEWRVMNPSNQDALQKQMAANGMPMPPEGGMPDPAKMQEMMLDNLSKQLGLSNNQREQVKPIMAGMGPMGMRALFEAKSLTQQQKMAKMQSSQAENDAKIRAVLTPDQQKKFDQMQAEMQQRMTAMRGRMPAGGPPGSPPLGMGPMMIPMPPGGGPPPGADGNNVTR